MLQALQEMFRDQPHLVFITLMVILLSFSGLAYLFGDYLIRRGRKAMALELAGDEVPPENVWTRTIEVHQPRRTPVAGQPRHGRPSRKVIIVRVENSSQKEAAPPKESGPERPEQEIPVPGQPRHQEQNSLKEAVSTVVDMDPVPVKKPLRTRLKQRSNQEAAAQLKQREAGPQPEEPEELPEREQNPNSLRDAVNIILDMDVFRIKKPLRQTEKLVVPREKEEQKQEAPVVNVVVTIAGMAPSWMSDNDSGMVTVETKTFTQEEAPRIEVHQLTPTLTVPRAPVKEELVEEKIETIEKPALAEEKEAVRAQPEIEQVHIPETEAEMKTVTAEAPVITTSQPIPVQKEIESAIPHPAESLTKTEVLEKVIESIETPVIIEAPVNPNPSTAGTMTSLQTPVVEAGKPIAASLNDTPEVSVENSTVVDAVEDSSSETILKNPTEMTHPFKQEEVVVKHDEADLRFIGYQPNKIFAQVEPWSYPHVSMPAAGCIVRPPRTQQQRRPKELVEEMFQLEMRRIFPAFLIAGNDCLPVSANMPAYEPDITLIVKGLGLNLFLDVEIDEPYDSITRLPRHGLNEDWLRDTWFTSRGWIVVRLAEEQVKKQPKHCLAYISKVIHSVYPEYHIPSHLKNMTDPKLVSQWTRESAAKMAEDRKREEYLEIREFANKTWQVETLPMELNEAEMKVEQWVR